MRYSLCIFMCWALCMPSAQARPISYPGGWTLITENNSDANALLVHYSPTAKLSLGYRLEYRKDHKLTMNALQINHLLQRWNKKNSQASFYFKSGFGITYSDEDIFKNNAEIANFFGFSADWEDRRFYMSYQNRYFYARNMESSFMQSARFGFAPYEGDYGDLHTWLMLDVKHAPEGEHKISATPLIRLFKGFHRLEAGLSQHGDALFNYTFRY